MNDSSPSVERPGHRLEVTLTDDRIIVTDPEQRFSLWDRHRQRQIARLAAVAAVRASYGTSADSRLVPPGPRTCPRTCPYCAHLVVVA